MPWPGSVETVRAMFEAFDARDAETYVSHLREDAVICPPAFLLGPREFQGRDAVREGFAELRRTLGPKRNLFLERRRYFLDREDASKVLVLVDIYITQQSGKPFGSQAALLLTMDEDNRVSRLDYWLDHEEGLAQLKQPVAVDVDRRAA